jgi:sulfite reductase (ferredoxin)
MYCIYEGETDNMATEQHDDAHTLLSLGVGQGSKVEHIKAESHFLRGQIVEELAQPTSHFSEAQVQLLKFHGTYQQENRDARQERKAQGVEKAYQFMIRSRIPGGSLTAEQYLVEDELAERYGNGSLRFTTRQSIQLHGVLKGNLHATIHEINMALLSTQSACGDVNRNVMACPALEDDEAHAQVQAIARQIAMHLAPRSRAYHEIWVDGEKMQEVGGGSDEPEVEPIYGPTYLPRKFKIGIAFPHDNCIDVFTQDIGLIARTEQGSLRGFTVIIGGSMGITHGKKETYPRLATPLCDITPDDVLSVVETIVTVQRDYGDRQNRKHARMKYVVEERGTDWFRNEVEQRLGRKLSAASPLDVHNVEDHLGWHRQHDGRWYLGLHVENGRVRDTETHRLKTGLRQVIAQFKPAIRLTPQQNILLADIAEEQKAAVETQLKKYGIAIEPEAAGAYRFAMACPALPTCGLALAEAERVLPSVIRQIEADLRQLGLADEPLSVRMTGCPNGCARPYMGDIGFVGRTKDYYHIYVGGDRANTRMNQLYAPSVHLTQLAATVRPLLQLWQAERNPQESFGDFCHRLGVEALRERVDRLVSVTAAD